MHLPTARFQVQDDDDDVPPSEAIPMTCKCCELISLTLISGALAAESRESQTSSWLKKTQTEEEGKRC
jgi:hypothetical protein